MLKGKVKFRSLIIKLDTTVLHRSQHGCSLLVVEKEGDDSKLETIAIQ